MSDDIFTTQTGVQFSLSDLAGVSFDDTKEFRFEVLPIGKYRFRIKQIEFAKEDYEDDDGEKASRVVVPMQIEVVEPIAVKGAGTEVDPASLVGKVHLEKFFLTDPEKGLGAIKAFCVDTGFKGAGSWSDIFAQMRGFEFIGTVKHTKSKRNSDVVFVNLDRSTKGALQPVPENAAAA